MMPRYRDQLGYSLIEDERRRSLELLIDPIEGGIDRLGRRVETALVGGRPGSLGKGVTAWTS